MEAQFLRTIEGTPSGKIENVGRISKTVRNISRVLHQLLKVMKDSKVEGYFTRMVGEGR